jgi:hypothetical protein
MFLRVARFSNSSSSRPKVEFKTMLSRAYTHSPFSICLLLILVLFHSLSLTASAQVPPVFNMKTQNGDIPLYNNLCTTPRQVSYPYGARYVGPFLPGVDCYIGAYTEENCEGIKYSYYLEKPRRSPYWFVKGLTRPHDNPNMETPPLPKSFKPVCVCRGESCRRQH